MSDLAIQLRTFIVSNFLFGQDREDLTSDESFIDSGIVDSTGVLELVEFIESRYGIRVEDRELIPDNLDSLRQLEAFVKRKLAGEAPLAG